LNERPSKKQAIEAYKNRPPNRGVFMVSCVASGECWVGGSQDLAAARNSTWFLLRSGRNRNTGLQAAWATHGEPSFRFEVLDAFDPDEALVDVPGELRRRTRVWAEARGATILLR
jgi:hypothetical protein